MERKSPVAKESYDEEAHFQTRKMHLLDELAVFGILRTL